MYLSVSLLIEQREYPAIGPRGQELFKLRQRRDGGGNDRDERKSSRESDVAGGSADWTGMPGDCAVGVQHDTTGEHEQQQCGQ